MLRRKEATPTLLAVAHRTRQLTPRESSKTILPRACFKTLKC
jgi:hypothetical protein